MRLAILCRDGGETVDAIRDHSMLLARALREHGAAADVHVRGATGLWRCAGDSRWRKRPTLDDYDAVLLEYSPFLYGRWGFAPWLPLVLGRLRLRRPRPRIAIAVHETAVRMVGWRWFLMGLWQRVQLHVLLVCADVVFVSVWRWRKALAPPWTHYSVVHLPSPSNLPDMRHERDATRRRLGVDPATLVVATLGTDHPSHLHDYVERTLVRLAQASPRILLLALGARTPEPRALPDGVIVRRPDLLPAEELARLLSAADLFLAPFDDGVSTRRTSMMAALQQEIAVVGTTGESTDDVLLGDALRLTAVGDPDRFADAAADLAAHPDRRLALAVAGRALYETAFDWPVGAERVLAGFGGATAGAE